MISAVIVDDRSVIDNAQPDIFACAVIFGDRVIGYRVGTADETYSQKLDLRRLVVGHALEPPQAVAPVEAVVDRGIELILRYGDNRVDTARNRRVV